MQLLVLTSISVSGGIVTVTVLIFFETILLGITIIVVVVIEYDIIGGVFCKILISSFHLKRILEMRMGDLGM